MAMMPKRVKWRKSQRGKIRGTATKGNTVAFGEYGLQCLGLVPHGPSGRYRGEHGGTIVMSNGPGRFAGTAPRTPSGVSPQVRAAAPCREFPVR